MAMGKWNLPDAGARGQSSDLEIFMRRNLGSKPLPTAKWHIHEGNSDRLAKKKAGRDKREMCLWKKELPRKKSVNLRFFKWV